ncbi:MAG: TRC40/GET3/ArsA family transport-energizing ATPase [Candidatus Helarchaeota archaeon]|nr:TRC40/GET3/ArsA family transport-energizing ATPase [Candidatus Helarchaeota archaeon]
METKKISIKELLTKRDMRFLLFGGKGGVGKTTCATSTAIWAAENIDREVLILSTDPAHSLSDSLAQDVSGGEVVPVKGVKSLNALEMNPRKEFKKYQNSIQAGEIEIPQELKMFGDFEDFQSISPPGSDETLAFSKVLEFIQTTEYDFIIFDTAPTGHTLRLLSLPEVLNSFFGKLIRFRMKMGQVWGKLKGLFKRKGDDEGADQLEALNHMKEIIENANTELTDPERTSFVIVMIPELMAVYETERLIQMLYEYEIPVSNIVINMIAPETPNCDFCQSRHKMHLRNMAEIRELYTDDFNLNEIPLNPTEVRGITALRKFGRVIIH